MSLYRSIEFKYEYICEQPELEVFCEFFKQLLLVLPQVKKFKITKNIQNGLCLCQVANLSKPKNLNSDLWN